MSLAAPGDRRVLAGIIALTIWIAMSLVAACTAPWRELNITGQPLAVIDLDGDALPPGYSATLLLIPEGGATESEATMTTSCGRATGIYGGDTDSDSISFQLRREEPSTCDEGFAAVDDLLLGALNTTTSWSVDSATEFTLHGAHEVHLRLEPAAPAESSP